MRDAHEAQASLLGQRARLAALATPEASALIANIDALVGEMYRDWPFFEGLMDDVEMRLARADMDIAWHQPGTRFDAGRKEARMQSPWVGRGRVIA